MYVPGLASLNYHGPVHKRFCSFGIYFERVRRCPHFALAVEQTIMVNILYLVWTAALCGVML